MTYSDPNRLDRIEALVESNSRQQLAEQQASSNAAVERLDRILDYLIRRDGER